MMDIPGPPTARLPCSAGCEAKYKSIQWSRVGKISSKGVDQSREETVPMPENRFFMPIKNGREAASFFWGVAICWLESFFKNPWKLAAGSQKWRFWKMISLFKGDVQVPRQFSRVFPKTSSHTKKKEFVTPPQKKTTKLRRGSRSWSIHIKYIKVCVFKKIKKLIPYESFGTHLSSVQNVWLTFHWILIDNIGSLCLLQSP